jgi:hypothetical protein
LVQVTVVPTATSRSSGAYARLPSDSAPAGIATDDDDVPGEGGGVGDGDVDDALLPQALDSSEMAKTAARVRVDM